jgi:hypothetical protein
MIILRGGLPAGVNGDSWSFYLRVLIPGVIVVGVVLVLFSGSSWPWVVAGETIVLALMLVPIAHSFGIGALFESRDELMDEAVGPEESARDLIRDLDPDEPQRGGPT